MRKTVFSIALLSFLIALPANSWAKSKKHKVAFEDLDDPVSLSLVLGHAKRIHEGVNHDKDGVRSMGMTVRGHKVKMKVDEADGEGFSEKFRHRRVGLWTRDIDGEGHKKLSECLELAHSQLAGGDGHFKVSVDGIPKRALYRVPKKLRKLNRKIRAANRILKRIDRLSSQVKNKKRAKRLSKIAKKVENRKDKLIKKRAKFLAKGEFKLKFKRRIGLNLDRYDVSCKLSE